MLMINFVTFMRVLGFCLWNTCTISTNFKNDFDAQNAGNRISRLQISKISRGRMPPDPPTGRGLRPRLWPSATILRSDFMAGSAPGPLLPSPVIRTRDVVAIQSRQRVRCRCRSRWHLRHLCHLLNNILGLFYHRHVVFFTISLA